MSAVIFAIFISLLIFSPLAFGTVERWSYTLMETLSFLALFLFLYDNRRAKGPSLREVPGLVPLLVFLCYFLLQLVPLPPGLLKVISPGAYGLYSDTLWVVDPSVWGSISINKNATMSEFFRVASYAAFYVLTIQLLTRKDLLKRTVSIVVIAISALAFFSMLQHFLWNGKIYWFRELTGGGIPFGPYVNRNHYAGLVDMVLPVIVCLFIYYRPRYFYSTLRERVVEAFSNPTTNVHILLGAAAALAATSVFLSLSRGGILSLLLSLAFLGMMLYKDKKKKGPMLVALVVIVVFYSVGWFGWDRIFERFEALRDAQGDISEMRLDIWRDTVSIMKDFPLTGTGLGSFMRIYPHYRSVQPEGIIDHAHNDFLELFSEGGIVAALIVLCFWASVIRKSYGSFRRRRERYSVMLYIGAAAGIVSMLIHSITDFNLHIGANALYLFFLTGLAVSAANTRMQDGLDDTLLRKTGAAGKGLIVTAAAALFLSAAFNAGALAVQSGTASQLAERLGPGMSGDELLTVRNASYRASFLSPFDAAPHYAAARAGWLLSDKNGAVKEYRKSVRLDPLNGELLQSFGLVLAGLGRSDEADRLLRGGIRCDVSNPLRYKAYASWLISSGKRGKGVGYVNKAISLAPERTRDYIALLVLYGFTDREIRDSLPEMATPHFLFADYLYKTGNEDMAAEEYHSAIGYVKSGKGARPSDFFQACQFFMKKGLSDDALAVMRKAEEVLPRDVGIKMTIAGIYEKTGLPYRAEEEYRKVLMIEPGNEGARRKLAGKQ